MKGILFNGKTAEYREDIAMPAAMPGHSLLRILRASICSTDREILRGYRPRFHGVMGHEFVGVVEKSEQKALRGKRAVGELNEGCGHCLYCFSGREKHCVTRKVIGMEGADGCFAEYMVLADHLLHVVPTDLPVEKAIYAEPLAAALEIPSQVHLLPDQNAAIIGDGRLAFMIAQVLAPYGMDLTVIGHHREKLERFRPYGKIVSGDDIPEVPDIGQTYETVVEASGSPGGLLLAKKLVRKCGTIVLKSTYAGEITLDMSYYVVNEITIKGSRCGPFDPALRLLEKGVVSLPEMEWHELRDFEAAFSSRAFKAGFRISE